VRSPEVFLHARRALLLLAVSVLVCTLPLVLLFDLRSVFDFDWFNHLWTIEYFGEYIRQHGTPPAVLSTENLVGIVAPLFYAEKFYLFTGIISSFLGSAISFRIVAFISLMIQFWHIERAVREANGNKVFSLIVATVVTWAIYPLTNLYNRSALTEFIAVIYLNSALSCLFVLLLRSSRGEKKGYYDAVAVGFLYAIAALTHPLTAAFGAVFLLCIGTSFLFFRNRLSVAAVGLINFTLIAGVLSPWLYVLHKFSAWLPVNDPSTNQKYFRGLIFPLESINNLWSLLFPVALDLRTLQNGVHNVSTPFLDAQINLPLLLLGLTLGCGWLLSDGKRLAKNESFLFAVMILSLFFFGLCLSVATHPLLSGYLGGFFDILQFPYRLTTYMNLAALTLLLAAAALMSNRRFFGHPSSAIAKSIALGLFLGISFSGLVTKLLHANATRFVDSYLDLSRLAQLHSLPALPDPRHRWAPGIGRSSAMLGILPTTFYSHSQFTVVEGYSLVKPAGFTEGWMLGFLPATGRDFGTVMPARIVLPTPTLVLTNVQPFPWNQIYIDGRQQGRGDLVVLEYDWQAAMGQARVLAIPLPAGEHTIEYRFRPDKAWSVFEVLSNGMIMGWLIIWIAIAILGAKDRILATCRCIKGQFNREMEDRLTTDFTD
jgi:hypothetical protein